MKKWLLISVFVVMVISFGATFYIQHQAFSEQKSALKSNFNKEQKKFNKQIKNLQAEKSELEKTIKINEDKTNALQSELDSFKTEQEQTAATSQEVADTTVPQQEVAPVATQEETTTPVAEAPKVVTNAAGQTREERYNELKNKLDSGELSGTDVATGARMMFKILAEEFPQ